MENRYGQIRRFLDIGAELAEGKYGDADGRISALLEAIAQSRDLRELFTAVTKDFDYPAACAAVLSNCIRYLNPLLLRGRINSTQP